MITEISDNSAWKKAPFAGRWWQPARLGWELRLCRSWVWALPVVGGVLVLLLLAVSGTPPAHHPLVMRQALELGLPLIGALLVVPLLETEWTPGTLAQVALRAALARVLLLRVLLVGIYLTLVIVAATLASLVGTPLLPMLAALPGGWARRC